MIHPLPEEEKKLTKWEKVQVTMHTIGIMAKGATYLIIGAYLAWLIVNFDVQIKAMKYPEAIRELKIKVTVAQLSK